ncbi:MAG: hypothetical protein ABI607_01575 [Betaproteobacteria bacterium]
MPGIRILKLVAKGDFASPQTLLVVGTATTRHDVWVSFDSVPPGTPLPSMKNSWSARAVPVDLDAIPTTRETPNGPPRRDAPYDIELIPGEWLWMARFDLPDQRNLSELWQWFVQAPPPDPVPMLLLRVWQTLPEPPRPESLDEKLRREFVSAGPPPAERTFAKTDVETLPLFELGVLLVHGIGKHRIRETLIRFGEPFELFWERWLRSVTSLLVANTSELERAGLHHRLFSGVWRTKQDHDGAIPELKPQHDPPWAPDGTVSATPIEPPGWACGVAHVEDTLFKTPGSEIPSSTLARLSVIGTDGELRQAHVLLSEAWWTGETFYPSFAELFVWITQALPVALRMYATGVLRSSQDDLAYSQNLGAGRNSGIVRVPLDMLALKIKYFVLLPLLVFAFALAQVGLLALLVLSLVPFEAVRGRIRGAVDLLLGTIGQSYALKTSSVRRNAIVRTVMRDLDAILSKCQRVAVVSHSQGAEVTRLVSQIKRWPQVRRWVTFGAGIVPLAMLDENRQDEMEGRWTANLLQLCSAVIAVIAILALAETCFATRLPWLSVVADGSRTFGLLLVLIAIAFVVPILAHTLPMWRSDFSRAMLARWHNYYASHDPVPGGPIQDSPTLDKDARIYNTRFGLRDHTSYFENTEQFVAPVALDLFELAGLGKCVAAAAPALEAAAARRDIYTWRRAKARGVALLAFIGIVTWTLFQDSAARTKAWSGAVSSAWASADGWAAWVAVWNTGILGSLVIEIWAAWALALTYFVLRPAWSAWWSRRSQERLYKDLASILNRPSAPAAASQRGANVSTSSP